MIYWFGSQDYFKIKVIHPINICKIIFSIIFKYTILSKYPLTNIILIVIVPINHIYIWYLNYISVVNTF